MPNFNIHWKIPFKSLRTGTLYTVNIWKDGALPSDYPLTLKGGAHPFATQEDDNEDQFAPVRTQTGYLRIVDDGKAVNASNTDVLFSWKDLMPQTDVDRPVTLTHIEAGATVVDWQGYLQAQTFTGELYGGVQVREFPVQCPLSALRASNVDGANRYLKNFAYVIKQAFDNLPCLTISNYIFQGGTYAQAWLLKLVDWQNLMSITDDGVTGAYDNQRAVQDVCAFWGWTCRVFGQSVIFSCTDDTTLTTALVLTPAQLDTMAEGSVVGSTGDGFLSALTLTGDIFASRSNNDTLVRGYNKAVVSTEVNQADSNIIKCFPNSVEEEMVSGGYYYGGNNTYYTNDMTVFYAPLLEGSCRVNYGSFNIARRQNDYDSSTLLRLIRIYKTFSSTSAEAYATLYTRFHHAYPGGNKVLGFRPKGLRLYGSAYRNGERYEDNKGSSGIGNKTMYIRIGIGAEYSSAKWWNGVTWSTVKSAFLVTLGNKDDLIWQKYQNEGRTTYDNIIPLQVDHMTSALHGRVFVEFLGSNDMPETGGEKMFELSGFRVEYFGGFVDYDIRGENPKSSDAEYIWANQGKACSEWDAYLIYASQNNLATGYGLVINNDDFMFMEKAAYPSNVSEHPEQRLATRVANYWATAKRMLTTELRANVIPSITPRHKVTVDGTSSYPIAISRDWWDDLVQLTLLEE